MTFLAYKTTRFTKDRLDLIGRINGLVEKYAKLGLSLTVRQVYYQFVKNNWLPNEAGSYGKVQGAINEGRLAGLISWDAIEDRTRSLRGIGTFDSPAQAIKGVAASYRRDLWELQPMRAEVWIEKDALVGVIAQICNKLRVDYYAQRGYNSQSEQWRAGQRFADYTRKGQRVIVFHLGDHDPSGVDMTRDNREKLELFAGTPIMVQRLALNMNQIEQYQPPPQWAKETDGRSRGYREQYGDLSWELDALEPEVIQKLIEDAVLRVRDEALFNEALLRETEERRYLEELSEQE